MAKPNKMIEAIQKQEISPEEKAYRSAVTLMDAVECVSRFEKVYSSLQDAARKFGKLGEYKDAAALRQTCLEQADDAVKTGTREVYDQAIEKEQLAKTKSDFVDAIEDFNRSKKFKFNIEECKSHIQNCQKQIARLETIAAYKRRAIALGILAVLAVLFIKSPGYNLAKGMVYQSRGQYRAAIAQYRAANGMLGGEGKMEKCYYAIAEKQYAKGKYKSALCNYKLADDKYDAHDKAALIEKMLIDKSEIGEIVKYGETTWIVLDKQNGKALLLKEDISKQKEFTMKAVKSNSWYDSKLRSWLNTKYKKRFTSAEKDAIVEQYIGEPAQDGQLKEYFFVLSAVQYERYKDLIPNVEHGYWLKDGSVSTDLAKCVDPDGNICDVDVSNAKMYVRQALWVAYK